MSADIVIPSEVKKLLKQDCWIYGCAYLTIRSDGTVERIPPTDVTIDQAIKVTLVADK